MVRKIFTVNPLVVPHKKERLQEILRQEVAEIIERDLREPGILATVTGVEISQDRRHATVFCSVYPFDNHQRVMQRLERAAGFVLSRLGNRLKIHPLPQLRFKLDTSQEAASRVDALLKQESSGMVIRHDGHPKRKLRKAS